VPSAISLRMSLLIWLWCMMSYPNSGPATANGISSLVAGGGAEAHALERPFDGPAGCGQSFQERAV
jgi:hypothetical protein